MYRHDVNRDGELSSSGLVNFRERALSPLEVPVAGCRTKVAAWEALFAPPHAQACADAVVSNFVHGYSSRRPNAWSCEELDILRRRWADPLPVRVGKLNCRRGPKAPS